MYKVRDHNKKKLPLPTDSDIDAINQSKINKIIKVIDENQSQSSNRNKNINIDNSESHRSHRSHRSHKSHKSHKFHKSHDSHKSHKSHKSHDSHKSPKSHRTHRTVKTDHTNKSIDKSRKSAESNKNIQNAQTIQNNARMKVSNPIYFKKDHNIKTINMNHKQIQNAQQTQIQKHDQLLHHYDNINKIDEIYKMIVEIHGSLNIKKTKIHNTSNNNKAHSESELSN